MALGHTARSSGRYCLHRELLLCHCVSVKTTGPLIHNHFGDSILKGPLIGFLFCGILIFVSHVSIAQLLAYTCQFNKLLKILSGIKSANVVESCFLMPVRWFEEPIRVS